MASSTLFHGTGSSYNELRHTGTICSDLAGRYCRAEVSRGKRFNIIKAFRPPHRHTVRGMLGNPIPGNGYPT